MKQNLIRKSLNRPMAIALASLAGSASIAHAHPGHSHFDQGISHALLSPNHLVVLGSAGLALFVVSWFVQKQQPRRAMQFAGALLAVGALAVWRLAA